MQISVIIPTYNAADTITRAIDSILAQSHHVDEILIIDDGSTDNTAEIVRNYGNAIRYFYQKNTGISGAMNYGMEMAKGDWIAILAADDEWLPNLVSSQIRLIEEHPELRWTYCPYEKVTQTGRVVLQIPQAIQDEIDREGSLSFFRAELAGFIFGACGFLVKRSVFSELGNYDLAMRNGQDGDMWCRIALKYPRVAVCGDVRWRYYLDNPKSLHRRGRRYRDLQLKSLCRNMRHAKELGPEIVKEFRPYARMKVVDYLIREAGRNCLIKPDTIEEAKSLFPLTARERGILRILKLLPKPIARKAVNRLRSLKWQSWARPVREKLNTDTPMTEKMA